MLQNCNNNSNNERTKIIETSAQVLGGCYVEMEESLSLHKIQEK